MSTTESVPASESRLPTPTPQRVTAAGPSESGSDRRFASPPSRATTSRRRNPDGSDPREFRPRNDADQVSGWAKRFIEYLQSERNAPHNTIRAYQADLVGLVDFCIGEQLMTVDSIDHRMLRRYITQLREQQQSDATIARKTASLRAFMRFLVQQGARQDNPADLLRSPRGERRLPVALSKAEVMRLLNAPSASSVEGLRDRAILEVLYSTGMRVGELVRLNLGDVDLTSGTVVVLGKRDKQRVAYLVSAALHALQSYLDRRSELRVRDASAIFLNQNGTRLTDRGVRRIFAQHAKTAELPDEVSPHTLRHSYATAMLDRGEDLRTVQEWLGHADISTTEIYTHLSNKKLDQAYDENHPRQPDQPSKRDDEPPTPRAPRS